MMTRRGMVFPLILVVCASLVGCSSDTEGVCTTEARSSVSLTVVDAAGAPVADATATYLVNGATAENCDNMMGGSYVCGYEQDGTITITVTKGADTKTQTVTVAKTADGCHVEGQAITITLGV